MVKSLALVATGIALGFFHVLTGPDHLSALAALSANENSTMRAFFLGVRWGVGHSTGLLLVGTVFIILSLGDKSAETVDIPDRVSEFFESLVGIFMIILGIYGIRRAWMRKPKTYSFVRGNPEVPSSPHDLEDSSSAAAVEITSPIPQISYHDHSTHHDIPVNSAIDIGEPSGEDREGEEQQTVSTKSLAILAGIVHGLAGPGGVLGVIPAVQLHNVFLASIYLTSFCVSSTLTMGCFAVTYGTCSSRLALVQGRNLEFKIECASASLCLLVGIMWLILLSLGKLEEIFP